MSAGETQKMVDAVAQATRTGLGRISVAALDQGWERLERALDEGKYPSVPIVPVRPRWWLRGLALGAAAALVAVAMHRFVLRGGEVPLRYVVEGAALGAGETIRTEATSAGQLVFSDDSRIRLAPSTKMRVLARDARGSRIVLSDGALDVEIRHRAGTSWRFQAGPFTVDVVGTSFHLGFDERRGRFTLQMSAGVVLARGPAQDRVFTLRGGESLELFTDAVAPPAKAVPTTSAPVFPAAALPAATSAAPFSAASPLPAHASSALGRRRVAMVERGETGPESDRWVRLIGRGDFAGVVGEAEQRGLDVVIASASAPDLTALADAARYLRRDGLARHALLGLRARFPGTPRASDAAFFLGRLAEQLSASPRAAVAWYDTYLSEAARGPYAGEALGREMALLAGADRPRARRVAGAYLERFPQGPQAELARSLVGEP